MGLESGSSGRADRRIGLLARALGNEADAMHLAGRVARSRRPEVRRLRERTRSCQPPPGERRREGEPRARSQPRNSSGLAPRTALSSTPVPPTRSPMMIPTPCECPLCATGGPLDPSLRTPRELLRCRRFPPRLGPSHPECEAESRYWARFEPHLAPWIVGLIEEGVAREPALLCQGAAALISTGASREGGDGRPRYSLAQADGHEILFENLLHEGADSAEDARTLLEGARSFAAHLGREGVLDGPLSEHLQRELALWGPRYVRFFERDEG